MKQKNTILNDAYHCAYALLLKDASIYLIKASTGPLKGLLNLAGGSVPKNSSSEIALKKTIKTQANLRIKKMKLATFFECEVPLDAKKTIRYYGMIYAVSDYLGSSEQNNWHPIHSLTQEMVTPWTWYIVENYLNANQTTVIKEPSQSTIAT